MWIEIKVFHPAAVKTLVIPHVGMWIEIIICNTAYYAPYVIPHVGMWIEMLRYVTGRIM